MINLYATAAIAHLIAWVWCIIKLHDIAVSHTDLKVLGVIFLVLFFDILIFADLAFTLRLKL